MNSGRHLEVRGTVLGAILLLLASSACIGTSVADARSDSPSALATVALLDLPSEARIALVRIRDNGPFPYGRDGVPFGNRERILPSKPRGYYHEYTVPTPGARNRGARRIVCGGETGTIAECYYSDDHYRSFKRIRS